MDKNEAERRARQWFEKKWRGIKTCSVCGSNAWMVGELSEVRTYGEGGLIIGGAVYPIVPLICSSCGNTIFFNALVMGIVGPSAPSATPAESQPKKKPSKGRAKPRQSE